MQLELSPQAVQLIATLFAANSPLQLPVGAAEMIVEIRASTQRVLSEAPQAGEVL